MITIISFQQSPDPLLEPVIEHYLRKLQHFQSVQLVYLKETVVKTVAENMVVNSRKVLAKISDKAFVVVLDLQGCNIDSIAMSQKYHQWLLQHRDVVMVIGPSDGISTELRQRANYLWKLSELTFTNHLCKVLLLEQLYRFQMIAQGQKYHK